MAIGYQQPGYQPMIPNYTYGGGYTSPVQNTQQMTNPQNNTQSNVIIADVNSKEEAFYWPISPGNSGIFRNKDGKAIYTKTAGYTAEPPIFEAFYKDEPVQNTSEPDYQTEIEKLWGEINALKNRQKPQNNKRREDGSAGNV